MSRTCADCIYFQDGARPRCQHPDGLTAPQAWLSCPLFVARTPTLPVSEGPQAPALEWRVIRCGGCGGEAKHIGPWGSCPKCGPFTVWVGRR